MPTRQEVIAYITESARRHGIDPQTSLRVFQQESGLNPNANNIKGPKEKSWGIAQLNTQGGLGNVARQRGIDPTDPSRWKEHVDFAHGVVAKDGWRQWYGARDVGIGRWQGVGGSDNKSASYSPPNNKAPKNIDLTATPQLAQLKPTNSKYFENKADAPNWSLGQTSPTEQSGKMARHPGFEDAIKQAMAEKGVQVAGFVPPGLTRGSAETRAAANKNVPTKGAPKSTVPDAERQIGRKDAPVTDDERAAISAWNEAHEKWLNGDGPNPGPAPTGRPEPRVRSATDPAGAADPRTGTSIAPYDPNLAAQNDPARQALMSAKIRGTAREGGAQPPRLPPPNQGDLAGPTAAAGAGAVVAGAMAGTQRPEAKNEGAGATGIPKSLEYLLVEGIPTIKEAMKDPKTAGATKQVIEKVISTKARQDAMKGDMANDPTYYQRRASQVSPSGQPADPSDPMYERRMMDAVVRDNQGVMRGRSTPQTQQQPAPQQQPQQSRGTVSVRPTPQSVRDADRPIPPEEVMPQQAQPVYPQPGPGQEKGDIPPQPPYRTAPQAGPSPHRFQQYADAPSSQGLPTGYQAPAESVVNHPYNGVPPQMTPQMMDPTMMQLMQFFTQGGGGGQDGM